MSLQFISEFLAESVSFAALQIIRNELTEIYSQETSLASPPRT